MQASKVCSAEKSESKEKFAIAITPIEADKLAERLILTFPVGELDYPLGKRINTDCIDKSARLPNEFTLGRPPPQIAAKFIGFRQI